MLHAKGLSAEFEHEGMYAVFHFTVWRTGEGMTENDRDLPKCLCLLSLTQARGAQGSINRGPQNWC